MLFWVHLSGGLTQEVSRKGGGSLGSYLASFGVYLPTTTSIGREILSLGLRPGPGYLQVIGSFQKPGVSYRTKAPLTSVCAWNVWIVN